MNGLHHASLPKQVGPRTLHTFPRVCFPRGQSSTEHIETDDLEVFGLQKCHLGRGLERGFTICDACTKAVFCFVEIKGRKLKKKQKKLIKSGGLPANMHFLFYGTVLFSVFLLFGFVKGP